MKLDTICVQGTYKPKNGEPRVIPIIQSTTYKYDSSVEMGNLFDLKESGYFYSRLQNPTCDNVAAKIAALEGGVAGMLTGSGQAANFYAVFNIAQAGDHIVSSSAIYGGTYNLFNVTMRKLGIDFTFVSPHATEEEIQAAIKPNTKAIFGETISNPSLDVLDIEVFAKVAHKNGIPLIVDNTFATPINCRVFDWGVDIVTHSTTKYMEGHASTIGGAIVDSGNFEWNTERYKGLAEYKKFGRLAYVAKLRNGIWRNIGCCLAPFNAFMNSVGLETLGLRMERLCYNALELAKFFETQDGIEVNYPALEASPYYSLCKKLLKGKGGAILTIRAGSKERAFKLINNLKYATNTTNIGDTRTLVIHPSSTIYAHGTEEQKRNAGVFDDTIRISVGIEDIEDLKSDFKQAVDSINVNESEE